MLAKQCSRYSSGTPGSPLRGQVHDPAKMWIVDPDLGEIIYIYSSRLEGKHERMIEQQLAINSMCSCFDLLLCHNIEIIVQ